MRKRMMDRGLVVSCQAYEGEPLYGAEHMAEMAKAAQLGGAIGIRANGLKDIEAIKQAVSIPVIGLYKRKFDGSDVYITPTLEDAVAVHEAGADIVAIDGTHRVRPDGRTLRETISELKQRKICVMADVSTFEEGVHAAEFGADYISTTMSGYTAYSAKTEGPDLSLVEQLGKAIPAPLVAEGRYSTTDEVNQALKAGAQFVVIGAAITRPQLLTQKFVDAILSQQHGDVTP